jgi:hypothetical protein
MHLYFFSTILPWISLFAWICFLSCALAFVPRGIAQLKKMPPLLTVTLIAMQLLAIIVRMSWVPDDHRIYFDEDRYLSYAVTFARFGQAVSVDVATPERSIMGIPDDAGRTTVPVYNAIIMRLFGYSEHALYQAARVFHSFAVIGIFILGSLLFTNRMIGLIGAFGIAFLPTPVYFAPSFGLDAYFMDLGIWSLIATLLFAKKPSWLSGAFWISATILFLCVRIESYVFLPVLAYGYAIESAKRKQYVFTTIERIIVLILSLFVVVRGVMSLTVFMKPWCCAEALPLESFSLSYAIRHILPNLFSLFSRVEFPGVISILAAYALFRYATPIIRLLGLWILLYFVTYSAYYAGLFFNPEFSGSYGRYLLMLIPPLLLLCGFTLVTWRDILQKTSHGTATLLVIFLAGSLSLTPTVLRYRSLIKYSPWDAAAEQGPRLVHAFLTDEVIAKTPPDAILIHNLTAPILLSGRTVVFTSSFLTENIAQNFVLDALHNGKKVYMLPHYRCLLYPDSCEDIMQKFRTVPFLKKDFGGGASLELHELILHTP